MSVELYARQKHFYMGSHSLLGSSYQNSVMVTMLSSNCCGGHIGFRRMPQIDSVRGLGDIKAISKCEVNLTSGFQDIAFTSNILYTVQC